MTPGFLARSASILLTQDPHVMPAMDSVHERTGSDEEEDSRPDDVTILPAGGGAELKRNEKFKVN